MEVGLVEISLLLVLLMILLLSSSSSLKYLLSIISSSTRSGSSSGGNAAVPLPPGSFGWPIIGETLIFQRSLKEGRPESFIRERMERYDRRVFKTGMFGSETAVLCGAAGHKFLFANENKLVRLWWPPSVQKLLRASLTAIPHADEAKRVRRILSSTLDPDALTRHVKTMDAFTLHHISSLWLGREEVSVYPTIHLYTFELACRLFMGLQDEQLMLKLSAEFHVFLKGVISIPLNLPGTRFYRAMRATEAIRIQLQALVRQRKSELLKKMTMAAAPPPPNSEDDLLSHLLKTSDEEGKFLTEEEIIDNMILLLFAGHDTTSSVITLLIKYLAQLPHVYDRVLREQMEIAKSKAERRRRREVLEWEDIQKMRYSWQVVSEVMRLTPPVIAGYREALVDFVYEGFRIPKGWKLLWSPATASKDPMMFGNAEEFEASRFEGTGPPPFSYVPFGGGPRMCLGKEYARLQILVFLHNIVNKFKWELLIPDEKVAYDPMPTPAKGLPIHLFPHTASSDAPQEQDFQEKTFPLQR